MPGGRSHAMGQKKRPSLLTFARQRVKMGVYARPWAAGQGDS
jgi:hypothetical protein